MPQSAEVPGLSGEAGGISNPRGVAGNPDTGRVYVADLENARIDEYTAWGLFVKAWGWDVAPDGAPGDTATDELETCGPAVPEADPPDGLCQAGDEGPGKGQLSGAMGLAVDASGNIYVFEWVNRRVQKFSPAGEFLLMFGGDVNRTKAEAGGALPEERNVCPVDPGDVCQAGIAGEEPGQLDKTVGDFIAYTPTEGGTILVGDKGGIQVFDLNGEYVKTISFEGTLGALAGKQVNGLDVASDANVYISLDATEDIYKLSPSGEPLSPGKPGSSSFKAKNPLSVAIDVEGGVYVIDDPNGLEAPPPFVLKYGAAGERLVPTAGEGEAGELFPERTLEARLTAIATNICDDSEKPGNLYVAFFNAGSLPHVSYVDAYGSGPVGCEPPPPVPPLVDEQLATFVGREEATLLARINPRFFPNTTYYVEYGTGLCSQGGCPGRAPLSPALLTDKTVNLLIPTTGVVLEGLAPRTTYRYRFVAQSGGGGPVYGTDPDGGGPLLPDPAHGLEGAFRTHAEQGAQAACPNDAFRLGPGAGLPDCRAYELVSPLEKGNADVASGIGRNNIAYRFFEVNQSALSGGRFTFTSATAFGDVPGAAFSTQYLAERGDGGWTSEAISAPRTESPVSLTVNFGPEFEGFSDDLCRGWLRVLSTAPLAPGAIPRYPNLYRRDNCADPPAYTALTTEQPPNLPPEVYYNLMVQGFSADGSHTIFTSPDELVETAAPPPAAREELLYEHTPGGLRFVCILPSGKPSTDACSAGTRAAPGPLDLSPLHNAISADGSRIFWTASSGLSESNPGRIFVRIDGKETVAVSGAVSLEPAFFWTAAEDGSRAVFSFVGGPRKGELYEFDVDARQERLIAKGVEGPLGASEDASRVYFASTEDLDGAGPAAVGAHNLYLHQADPGGGQGSSRFVTALVGNDVELREPTAPGVTLGVPGKAIHLMPAIRAARVTPDGLHATFLSAAPPPSGYDNRDIATGKAAGEVYRYDAVAGTLLCVSCNPTGARPVAGFIDQGIFAAARIQGWETLNHAPRVISDDGSRVFFESHEALVPDDSNGTWDVYQWEEPGRGTCNTFRPTYSDLTGGCVDLISSGQSPLRSLFLDADPSGDNVFIGTQSSLIGSDYGLNDVYVARVGGGFPEPVAETECEGDACPNPAESPPLTTPSSEAFRGPGNKAKRPCPKGKRRVVRKGRARCVRKHRKHRRRASHRRGGRG